MPVYRVDPMWGQSCSAYHVQYRFADAALEQISAIQDNIEQEFPGLRRVPLTAIHMTVLTLLHPEGGREADEVWGRHRAQWADGVANASASTAPFRLTLDTVAAFDAAIVLMTRQCGALQALREMLVRKLSLPGTAGVPRIAHTSLFRYADIAAAGEDRLRAVARTEALDVEVADILLVRETRYPSLDIEMLRRFRLSG